MACSAPPVFLLAMIGLSVGGPVASAPPPAQPWVPAIRTAGVELANIAAAGRERSSTFRKLWHDLEASDWIVFVQTGSCGVPRVVSCLLHRIGAFEGHHYLRVVIAAQIQPDDEAIAALGHELQHVAEVLREPRINTSEDIRELYRRTAGELYETDRAVRVGQDIRRELRLAHVARALPTAAQR